MIACDQLNESDLISAYYVPTHRSDIGRIMALEFTYVLLVDHCNFFLVHVEK